MLDVYLYKLTIPMLRSFNHAYSKRCVAGALILSINYQSIIGLGECVPRVYVTGETLDSVSSVLQNFDLQNLIHSWDLSSESAALEIVLDDSLCTLTPNARCIIDLALLDWLGKYFKKPLDYFLKKYFLIQSEIGELNRYKFGTSQVMDLTMEAEHFVENRGPFGYIKVKVNNDLASNIARLSKLRERLGYKIPIMVDANMVWSFDQAVEQINAMQPFRIDYFEEPLKKASWNAYRELRKLTSAQILLDESVCTLKDLTTAINQQACDSVNIRVSKCGGLSASCEIISLAKQSGLDYQIGAQVAETGPLIAAGRHLRAAVKNPVTFEAGQPDRFFGGDYIVTPMPLVDRTTNAACRLSGDGLGVQINENLGKYVTRQLVLISNKKREKIEDRYGCY